MAKRRAGRKKKQTVTLSNVIWVEIDNPDFSRDHEEGKAGNLKTTRAMLNMRESPALWMLQHNYIDQAQYRASDRFRRLYEQTAGSGVKGMDTAKEPVDGGKFVDSLTDARMQAAKELVSARRYLGDYTGIPFSFELVERVCGQCYWIKDLYDKEREQQSAGRHLKLCLDGLAELWDYKQSKIRVMRR